MAVPASLLIQSLTLLDRIARLAGLFSFRSVAAASGLVRASSTSRLVASVCAQATRHRPATAAMLVMRKVPDTCPPLVTVSARASAVKQDLKRRCTQLSADANATKALQRTGIAEKVWRIPNV